LERRTLAEAMQHLLKDKKELSLPDLAQVAALVNNYRVPDCEYLLVVSEEKPK
jgi:hypothetical protein